MKKLLIFTLITACAVGSALAEKPMVQQQKPVVKSAFARWRTTAVVQPVAPITDPKELSKQVKDLNKEIRKISRKIDRYIDDRSKAANRGDVAEVKKLDNKIQVKHASWLEKRALLRRYTFKLATIQSADMKKDKKAEKKEKKAKAPKEKGYAKKDAHNEKSE